MSIRWHFMSKRPSSNTANSPTGPAPTTRTSVLVTVLMRIPSTIWQTRVCLAHQANGHAVLSALTLRNPYDQPVQRVAHLDLARQPGTRLHFIGEVEHILFHRFRLAD